MSIPLIDALSTREAYDRYWSLDIADMILDEELQEVYLYMTEYWMHTKTDEVDWSTFYTEFAASHKLTGKRKDLFKHIFDRLTALQAEPASSKPEAVALLKTLSERLCAEEVIDLATKVANGDKGADMTTVTTAIERSSKAMSTGTWVPKQLNIKQVLAAVTSEGEFKWRCDALNRAVGPLRKGNMMVVAKRPDAGGTTFIASECTFIAPQLNDDRVIMWLNNEEMPEMVHYRLMQAALNRSVEEIRTMMSGSKALSAEGLQELYYASLTKTKGVTLKHPKIQLYSDTDLPTFRHLREEVERLDGKVALLCIDQLWKMRGFERSSKSETDRLHQLFLNTRRIAHKHCPVIVSHQAGSAAENKKWIDLNEMYYSGTAIQGEADAIIGLGRLSDPAHRTKRYICVPKNKLPGGPSSVPSERNGQFEVNIDVERARIT